MTVAVGGDVKTAEVMPLLENYNLWRLPGKPEAGMTIKLATWDRQDGRASASLYTLRRQHRLDRGVPPADYRENFRTMSCRRISATCLQRALRSFALYPPGCCSSRTICERRQLGFGRTSRETEAYYESFLFLMPFRSWALELK